AALPGHLHTTWDIWNRDLPLWARAVLGAGFVVALLFAPWLSRFRIPPAVAVAFWAGLLVLVQRVIPYPRVWRFYVPLYLSTFAAFLTSAARRVSAGTRGAAPVLQAGAHVAVVAALTAHILT